MANNIQHLQAEIVLILKQIEKVCELYQYDVKPTLVLRHREGGYKSMLISREDDAENVIQCIRELQDDSEVGSMSTLQAEEVNRG